MIGGEVVKIEAKMENYISSYGEKDNKKTASSCTSISSSCTSIIFKIPIIDMRKLQI